MNSHKLFTLPALAGLFVCLTAAPVFAGGGRINQGTSGLGELDCATALTDGAPWVQVLSGEVQVTTGFSSCPPSDGSTTVMWDLYTAVPPAGDDLTLVVKNSSDAWGIFDVDAFADSGDTTCGDPLGSVSFNTCIDSPTGTVFKDAINPTAASIVFYTDPGALQYLSETDPNGKVTVLAGSIPSSVPEPSSVWLVLTVALAAAVTISRRRQALSRAGQ